MRAIRSYKPTLEMLEYRFTLNNFALGWGNPPAFDAFRTTFGECDYSDRVGQEFASPITLFRTELLNLSYELESLNRCNQPSRTQAPAMQGIEGDTLGTSKPGNISFQVQAPVSTTPSVDYFDRHLSLHTPGSGVWQRDDLRDVAAVSNIVAALGARGDQSKSRGLVVERYSIEPGDDEIKQDVSWNCDNDNGSENEDFIPALRDYQASPAQYLHPEHPEWNTTENDLVQLNLAWLPPDPPPPNPIMPPVEMFYKIDIVQSGAGQIKLWDSQYKQTEIVSNQQGWIAGDLPQIWMEGINPSMTEYDITVTAHIKAVHVMMGNYTVYQDSKPTKIEVTPILKQFYVDNYPELPPPSPQGYWIEKPSIVEIPGAGKTVAGYVRLFATLKGASLGQANLGPNQTGLKYSVRGLNQGILEGLHIGVKSSIVNSSDPAIKKRSYPFLDSRLPTIPDSPYPYTHFLPGFPSTNSANEVVIKTDDTPFEQIDLGYEDPANNNARTELKWMKVDFRLRFRTYVGIAVEDANNPRNAKTFQPLGYLRWEMIYKFKRTTAEEVELSDDGSETWKDPNYTPTKTLAADELMARALANEKIQHFLVAP
jgi:hypothetical protein